MTAHGNTYGGNKSYLEQKPCTHCGRPMTWRKKWARTWGAVRYCSERCRREARQQRSAASDADRTNTTS